MVSTGNAMWSSRFAFIMASVGLLWASATFGAFHMSLARTEVAPSS
ncbi:MAG: hypothetical protein CM15mP74_02250 [Halieaceae bacterium]|nr:MAG: hypothetical protein CM15mP74_02250 [Halieaceae bacterium]